MTTSRQASVFVLNVMGPILLGPWCLFRIEPSQLLNTPALEFGMTILCGSLSLLASLLVTKSFQYISVVRVNVLNNGLCTSLTVMVGMIFSDVLQKFVPGFLILGMVLSFSGIIIISLNDPNQDRNASAEEPSEMASITCVE